MKKIKRPELFLHPNIPKPLHTVAPREIYGDIWWEEVRQKAYRKNMFVDGKKI